jgi:small subunit ribosomal protein S1
VSDHLELSEAASTQTLTNTPQVDPSPPAGSPEPQASSAAAESEASAAKPEDIAESDISDDSGGVAVTPQTADPGDTAAKPDAGSEHAGPAATPQATDREADAADPTPAPIPAPGESAGSKSRQPQKGRGRARQVRTASLYRSFRTRRSLEGRVERVIKGGYEVKLGRVRGFCPHSQIDIERASEPEQYVGKTLLFRITQLRRSGEDVVISRRVILEEDRAEEAKAVRATLLEGSVMQGRVAGIANFGAFVDLGAGVMGLVHVSELSHVRIDRVEEAVKIGEPVWVKVLKVDEGQGRISLSLRQAQHDPWDGVAERFEVDGVYPGATTRLADFGAFIEMEPGVEALAPASEFPPSRSSWSEGLEPGQERRWQVLSIDTRQRRISVAPAFDGELRVNPETGTTLRGKVQRVEKFGVFVWLGPGRVGLMPSAFSGAPRGADLTQHFPLADEIEVDVLEIGDSGRRIRLAKKGVRVEAESRKSKPASRAPQRRRFGDAPRDAGKPAAAAKVDTSFGSLLADKLRAALNQSERSS